MSNCSAYANAIKMARNMNEIEALERKIKQRAEIFNPIEYSDLLRKIAKKKDEIAC